MAKESTMAVKPMAYVPCPYCGRIAIEKDKDGVDPQTAVFHYAVCKGPIPSQLAELARRCLATDQVVIKARARENRPSDTPIDTEHVISIPRPGLPG